MAKVVTWQSPSGARMAICGACAKVLTVAGRWPKDHTGQEYCSVYEGGHRGECQHPEHAELSRHKHKPVRESGPFGYTQSVAVYPYTKENRAAHGGVQYVQHCSCGAVRSYLVNGRQKEWGVWRRNSGTFVP